MNFGRSGGTLDGNIRWIEIIIWGVSRIGNYHGLGLGISGSKSYGKVLEGDLRIRLVSNIYTDDVTLLGSIVYLTVVKMEVSLLRLLVDVLFGWPTKKYVEPLLGGIIG